MKKPLLSVVLVSLWLTPFLCPAHPIPDIPVRSFFEIDGSARIEVEIDLRCFSEDPENEPYVQHWVAKAFSDKEKKEYFQKANAFVAKSIAFYLDPKGEVNPQFSWNFTAHRGETLEAIDDPVMLTGTWKTRLEEPSNAAYRLEALPEGTLSVLFLNHINDEAVKRFQVLFPGEKSYQLELSGLQKAAKGPVKTSTPATN